MMVIPDYLVYDELRERQERDGDGGLQPLHLPLYQPEMGERRSEPEDSSEEKSERGVLIIDMNTGVVIAD